MGTEIRDGMEMRDVGVKLVGIFPQSPPFTSFFSLYFRHLTDELTFSLVSKKLVEKSPFLPSCKRAIFVKVNDPIKAKKHVICPKPNR